MFLLLYAASGRENFFLRASAALHAAHHDGPSQFTSREDLRRAFRGSCEPRVIQRLHGHLGPLRDPAERIQTNDLRFFTKRVRESALGHTTGERHLATLEMWLVATRSVMA